MATYIRDGANDSIFANVTPSNTGTLIRGNSDANTLIVYKVAEEAII